MHYFENSIKFEKLGLVKWHLVMVCFFEDMANVLDNSLALLQFLENAECELGQCIVILVFQVNICLLICSFVHQMLLNKRFFHCIGFPSIGVLCNIRFELDACFVLFANEN